MIATPNLDEILGAEVVDPNNDAVGKVGRIYLDADRDVPTWVSVRTGLFGLSETLVPVDDATWEGQVLRVTVEKARIKDAPRVEVDEEIAPEDQVRLYSYYDRAAEPFGAEGPGDYASGAAGFGGAEQGRPVDRSGEVGGDVAGAGAMGAAGAGGMGGAGAGGVDAASASTTATRASATGDEPHRHEHLGDEPLGGGNHNPAAYEADEDQRLREAGRSAGDGQLGGGNQNPNLLEGREEFGADAGELGGGNQNPALYERREDRSLDAGDLGGGNQNPGGVTRHTGVGAATHGGPGEFTRPGAGPADAGRRSAGQDDPGRMRMTEGGAGEQQDATMRLAEERGTRSPGGAAMGASGEQGVRSPGGGGMRLRRYVVTEQQTVTMPVTREEFRLEPEGGEGGEGADKGI